MALLLPHGSLQIGPAGVDIQCRRESRAVSRFPQSRRGETTPVLLVGSRYLLFKTSRTVFEATLTLSRLLNSRFARLSASAVKSSMVGEPGCDVGPETSAAGQGRAETSDVVDKERRELSSWVSWVSILVDGCARTFNM